MGCGRALAAAVGVAFDDELVAGGGEPADGGLGEQRSVMSRNQCSSAMVRSTT